MNAGSGGFDYDQAAPIYDRHRRGAGPYFPRLVGLAREFKARRVLEIGAGTGNETFEFLAAHPSWLVALERSGNMLAHGRAKGLDAAWLRGSATHLPFQARRFDFLYAVYVLHHLPDLALFMSECARVLDHGCAAFVTVSQEFIRRHPMNDFFPSIPRVDGARFQPIPRVEAAMRAAGFRGVRSEDSAAPPKLVDADYIQRIADQFVSTYALLPEDEFETGLARLRKAVLEHGREITMVREAAIVWGHR